MDFLILEPFEVLMHFDEVAIVICCFLYCVLDSRNLHVM